MHTEAVLFTAGKINNDGQEKRRFAKRNVRWCERKSQQKLQTSREENENKETCNRTQRLTVTVLSQFLQLS